ncbi:hypothetical protein C8A01DRAFT_40065 [Parachaetomium inaequale]|uniref:FAD-binding domain-containing protein n=1 Tax=Parachaetomium inaequale TaxID=2588326 RepID=A0AAN6SN75_9PEZI|nr:hypothetical protein C8A01DRAFT_40065 [Parachaetomium inaequale]
MGSMGAPDALKVLVVGAGSAGLLLAQVFKKAGINATVFERDESPTARPRDWNFGIYWAQSRVEECLTPELNALIDTTQSDPSYRRYEESTLPIHNGVTGEVLKELPAPDAIRLRRRAWLNLIRAGVDVRYGKKLQTITTTEQGVTVAFEDGTVESGALLIGADGARSATRNWLFQSSPEDAELRKIPISSFVAITKVNRDTALALRKVHPLYCMTLDPNGLMTWLSLHDASSEDPADWTFMIILTWNYDEKDDHASLAKDNDLLMEKARAHADTLAYPFSAVVRDIPQGTKAWYCSQMTYWPTKPWDNRGGRVTLAGDAAHAMTFHRGQGLGNAITDVAELQTHLRAMKAQTREELAMAVAKYEREVWQRGLNAVVQNRENSLALHNWEKLKQSPLFVVGVHRDPLRQGDEK